MYSQPNGSMQRSRLQLQVLPFGSTYKVTTSGLNVRSGPGTGTLARLSRLWDAGQSLFISNGWATITYSGKKAYVSTSYLAMVDYGGDSETGRSAMQL